MVKKKTNKKSPLLSEGHSGVLLEDLDSKMDLVLEGYQVLNKKVDDLVDGQEVLNKKFGYLDKKVGSLDEKMENLDKKVDGLDKKVDKNHQEMNQKFDIVFDKLHSIRNELKEKVNRDEFSFLEKRVVILEKLRK